MAVGERKAKMRLDLLNKLRGLSPQKKAEGTSKIGQRLADLHSYREARRVMYYVGVGLEIETIPFISQALEEGKEIFVPSCLPAQRSLLVSRLRDLSELSVGHYGLLEPKAEFLRPHDPGQLDLVILPGLAFDLEGNRLGRGGGYYDRLLAQLDPRTVLVALAFDFQVREQIPREEHDRAVHKIVTPNGIIACRALPGEN